MLSNYTLDPDQNTCILAMIAERLSHASDFEATQSNCHLRDALDFLPCETGQGRVTRWGTLNSLREDRDWRDTAHGTHVLSACVPLSHPFVV